MTLLGDISIVRPTSWITRRDRRREGSRCVLLLLLLFWDGVKAELSAKMCVSLQFTGLNLSELLI
jgi:hypothetical protein